jgi:hypothetical protein
MQKKTKKGMINRLHIVIFGIAFILSDCNKKADYSIQVVDEISNEVLIYNDIMDDLLNRYLHHDSLKCNIIVIDTLFAKRKEIITIINNIEIGFYFNDSILLEDQPLMVNHLYLPKRYQLKSINECSGNECPILELSRVYLDELSQNGILILSVFLNGDSIITDGLIIKNESGAWIIKTVIPVSIS